MIAEKNDMEKPGEGNRPRSADSIGSADSRFDSERAELFEALGHETRIRILQILSKSPSSFSELKKGVKIESSGNLSFHLGKLGNLIRTDSNGDYLLTDDGQEAVRVIDTSIECGISRKLGNRGLSPKFNLGTIAISIVWAVMMVVVSLFVRGDAGLGTNLLFVEMGGFIASFSILSWLGRVS
jgi:hypothetical protein